MSAVATLTPVDLEVDPGSRVSTTIKVRNAGSIVDRFDIDVVGVTGWVQVDPPALSLFPGAEGTATITFAPPRASNPRAGTLPFGVRVRPAADPKGSTVEEGRVTVAPFSAVAADIAPQTSRGSRRARHDVAVENRGNAPVEVVVAAVDPDRRLGLAVDPGRAVIGPEGRASFAVAVSVDDPFPFGPKRQRPFQVNVAPGRQAPIQLRATMNQGPLLPGWIPPLGGIALAAAALAVVAFAAGLGPFAPKATPSPSVVALASTPPPTESPSAPPTEAPSTAAPSSEASPTASPTPRPLTAADFKLAVTGDNVQLGNGLALKCPADNSTCRDTLKDELRQVLNELKNPYTGQGILTTQTIGTANTLPVVLSSKQDFGWSSEAGQSGTTRRAVFDFGPLLANPTSYVYAVVDTADGTSRRFAVDPQVAPQLFGELYQVPDFMSPGPGATPLPLPVSAFDQVAVSNITWDLAWVLSSPTP